MPVRDPESRLYGVAPGVIETQLLDRSPSPQRSAVLAMIAQRLFRPASKLATTRLWYSPPWPPNSTSKTLTKTPSAKPWTGCCSARTVLRNASRSATCKTMPKSSTTSRAATTKATAAR